ncbi:immune inhibitor A domain-containing protein [Pseudalkalibacillus sp. R45]|uniref:immune inhibitor A domain-containing protein n=1 Tax=Pseudalkalibacillus sp. R45 TaxID=3457433 RepID=UPI003FCE685E
MKNWKRTLGVSALTAGLVLGSITPFASAANDANPLQPDLGQPGPIDMGIINDERLIESLIERGEISRGLSAAGKERALKNYLEKRTSGQANEHMHKGSLGEHKGEKLKDTRDKLSKGKAFRKHRNDGRRNGFKLPSIKKENWNGDVRTDNVLVIAIDFSDYKTGDITSEETDMYYDEYPMSHYQDMIFGDDGYEGPNGENLISMKQYYEQQSGGSYSVNGNVAGWYTADHPAEYYGGNVPTPDGNDARPRSLVAEALTKAAADPSVDLSQYDQEDRYDLDGDGNYREADGIIDHLMVIHAGVGEEAGGGSLGGDAIWSHRWNLGGVFSIPGSPEPETDYWGEGTMYAYDYTIEPEDGATGVFAHEYGHDLELPDEYDTQYSGEGEPVAYWSIMSSGSWAGEIPGTEPTGFSAWSKEFLQGYVGGNWLTGESIDASDSSYLGDFVLLDQANDKGTWNDAVRVDLPDKVTVVNEPSSGQFEYWSGKGNDLDNSMVTSLDLTNATNAELTFKTWYEIEQDWDYASIQVKEEGSEVWVAIPGNLTTTEDPHEQNPGHGITGHSDGWVDGVFDLSAYAGQNIELKFNYWTDVAAIEKGFYVDDIAINVDGSQLLFDDAEADPAFTLEGFQKDEGKFSSEHYYLLEWRNHQGVDLGLKHIARGESLMEYDEGLIVWYVDNSLSDNWTGLHPGEGFLGVVDAHQNTVKWSDGSVAATRYQINDAAFGINKTNKDFLDYRNTLGITLTSPKLNGDRTLDDSDNYLNPGLPDAGRNIPEYGLNFVVLAQAKDKSTALVGIYKERDRWWRN